MLDFKVLKIIWLIFSRIPIRSTGFWCWILLVFFQCIGPFCGKDLGFKGLGFTCKKTVEDVVQLESIQAEVQWPVFTSSSHSCHCGSWHNASTVPTPSQHQRILQGYRFFTCILARSRVTGIVNSVRSRKCFHSAKYENLKYIRERIFQSCWLTTKCSYDQASFRVWVRGMHHQL